MRPFVILGASKTGTSTAVAVANGSPSVFCLYESDFSQPSEAARNADLVALVPEARALFGAGKPFATCLGDVGTLLARRGWRFDFVGTKVQGVRPDLLSGLGDTPVLFMVRDVRLWAVKNRVLRDVLNADSTTNIVPHLVAYARYFLDTFLLQRCVRLPLERVFTNDLTVLPATVGRLLDKPAVEFTEWWSKAPVWKKTAPKNYSSWIEGHTSAFLPPVLADTTSHLAPHPFWDVFLPVFDKYYRAPDKTFVASEVSADQEVLSQIALHHTMTLAQGFARFESFKIRGLSKLPDGKFSIEATDRVNQNELDAAAGRWRPEQI